MNIDATTSKKQKTNTPSQCPLWRSTTCNTVQNEVSRFAANRSPILADTDEDDPLDELLEEESNMASSTPDARGDHRQSIRSAYLRWRTEFRSLLLLFAF